MYKQGFTFVEILVVISILLLVSTLSISSLLQNSSRQEIKANIEVFSTKVQQMEYDMQEKKTLNYNIFLIPGISYHYELNRKTEYINLASYDILLGNYSIQAILSPLFIGQVDVFYGSKYEKTFFQAPNTIHTGTFILGKDIRFRLKVDEKEKNTIGIEYYGLGDIKNTMKNLTLKAIWSNVDKTGTSYTGIIIQNRDEKKILQDFAGKIIPGATLFFEKGGKEHHLTLP